MFLFKFKRKLNKKSRGLKDFNYYWRHRDEILAKRREYYRLFGK